MKDHKRHKKLRLIGTVLCFIFMFSIPKVLGQTPIDDTGWGVELIPDDVILSYVGTTGGAMKLQLELTYDNPAYAFGIIGEPLYIRFTKLDSSAPPNITILDQTIKNYTESTWTAYRMVLAWNIVEHEYSPIFFGVGVNFKYNSESFPFYSAEYGLLRPIGPSGDFNEFTQISFFNGMVPDGQIIYPGVGDSSDNHVSILTIPELEVGQSFFLKQYPMSGFNMKEFGYFADHWLDTGCQPENGWCGGCDKDFSGFVDIADFQIFVSFWLQHH